MKRLLFSFIFLSLSLAASADPKLSLVQDAEWKGKCRKEGSTRLQSTYSYQNGELSWWVRSYQDPECTKLHDGNKYTLKCEFTLSDQFAKCTQTKWEATSDGKDWQPKAMVDHAGYTNSMQMKVKFTPAKAKQIRITTVGDSDEAEFDILSR